MTYLDNLIGELKTIGATVAALPTPGSGEANTYSVVQGMNKNFVEEINEGTVLWPLIVVELGKFEPELEFGIDNWGQNRIPTRIHYVAQLAGVNGTQGDVDEVGRNIVNFIDNPANSPFQYFGAYESGEVISDLGNPIMDALFAVSKVNIVSSTSTWLPGFLVTWSG